MKTIHSIYLLLFFAVLVSCKNETKGNTEAEILQEDVTGFATDIPYFENKTGSFASFSNARVAAPITKS